MLARTHGTIWRLTATIGVFSVIVLASTFADAQQTVRYYTENGVTYKEVRTTRSRPVLERRLESRERTVYREQYSTQTEPQLQTVHTPVTTYRWQGRWHDVLNPFSPPYLGYHLVPQTHWESRVQQVNATVTRRELLPEKQVINVPVTTQRYVNDEVIHRTVISTPPGAGSVVPAVASRAAIGGISQVQSDPPREGSQWRASTRY